MVEKLGSLRMMLVLLDRIVSSFSVLRLVIVSCLARLVALLLLPNTPSFLAPDEGTYAFLASWVADSKDVEVFPGFGPSLYNISKTLILPAVVLIRLGIDEITAVRVISIGFGILSIYLFAKIILLVLKVNQLQDLGTKKSQRLTLVGMCVFAFLPSSFIWSTLGLRESASKAMTLASVYLLLRLRDSKSLREKSRNLKLMIPIWILGILAISLSFGARKQTAIVFVVFFCISLVATSKGKNLFSTAGVVIVGTAIGLLFSTTPITRATTELVWTPVQQPAPVASESKSPAPVASDPAPSARCNVENMTVRTSSGILECKKRVTTQKEISATVVIAQLPIKNIDELESKREINRVGAVTQLKETKCISYTNLTYENLACNLGELPFRLASILFRPLPFIDEGSLSNNLASAENMIWIILFSLFAYSLVTSMRNKIKLYIVLPTALYVLAFANLSALYEGNLGTAFRHKSTILWGLILVVTVVFSANRTDFKEVNQKS